METTFAEILEMRRKLNEALLAKSGRELASGFNVEVSSWEKDKIAFCTAYTRRISPDCEVSGYYAATPKEAFDNAMKAIDAYEDPTNEQIIKKLKEQIEALQNE